MFLGRPGGRRALPSKGLALPDAGDLDKLLDDGEEKVRSIRAHTPQSRALRFGQGHGAEPATWPAEGVAWCEVGWDEDEGGIVLEEGVGLLLHTFA